MPLAKGRVLYVAVVTLVFAFASSSLAQPSLVGEWSEDFVWGGGSGIEAIHAVMLPTGKVMFWQNWTQSVGLWDIETNSFSAAAFPDINIFCSGHAWLADGRLMVVGGHLGDYVGDNEANLYDPFTNTWAENVPAMNATNGIPDSQAGRWYPSVTTLGTGEILVMSGNQTIPIATNPLPQIYNPATNTWRDLTTAKRGLIDLLPPFPRVFQAPDGRVVSLSDYNEDTEFLDVTGTGSWEYLEETLDGGLWDYGPAVMYDAGKIAYMGGGILPTSNISLLDLNEETPSWAYAAEPMHQPRRQNDATILADGTVLITGGTSAHGWNDPDGLVAAAEIWDPDTQQVTQVATSDPAIYRGYHSTATLLPDGRVLITGGEHDHGGPIPANSRNAEIYSPPYLFKGDRPTVTTAPDNAEYGDSIFVETPDSSDIAKAIMIVPGATTHSQNWTQRANVLDFSLTSGGINILLPTNPNEAPPGYYMLFLVNEAGVPSLAEWLLVEFAAPGLDGDFNDDGTVDAADYTAWLDSLGSPAGTLPNDTVGGTIGMAQYQLWKENFGATMASGSSTPLNIPEPDTLSLLTVELALLASVVNYSRRSARGHAASDPKRATVARPLPPIDWSAWTAPRSYHLLSDCFPAS